MYVCMSKTDFKWFNGFVETTTMLCLETLFVAALFGFLLMTPFTGIFTMVYFLEGVPIERFNRAHVETECVITSIVEYPQWCTTACINHVGKFCTEYGHSMCYSRKLTAKHAFNENVTIFADPYSPFSKYMVGTTFTCYYNKDRPHTIQMNLKKDDTKIVMMVIGGIQLALLAFSIVLGIGFWCEKLVHRRREDYMTMLSKEV